MNVNVSQRQVLTPGMVQMVRVLALNKLELKEMINAEVVENPVLEEIEDNTQSFEELAKREGERELSAEEQVELKAEKEKDPFDEIDFGSYFQEYMDPGFRAPGGMEDLERPSFENFLSSPTTLADHLHWQLGSLSLSADVRQAAEFLIGNLDERGYLAETDLRAPFPVALLDQAFEVIQQLDPTGVGARNLQECLLLQLRAMLRELQTELQHGEDYGFAGIHEFEALFARKAAAEAAMQIVQQSLPLLEKRATAKEIAKAAGCDVESVPLAQAVIRTLDPRPGQRYNQSDARLIEPDVAFVRRGEEFVVVMNEEDMPALRLNAGYRRMLRQDDTSRDVKEYVKERFRSAIQLLRNIEQRKNTILRVCEVIVRRQHDFLERGMEGLRPMMIKEVAEEIGVHPSTVSRAVANKYVHTAQGVYELRFFFSEAVNGPEGGDLPLLLLKKKVREMIEAEDPHKPVTDDALAAELNRQGIQVTRRTVAKYREDMQIPSTHKRRKKD